MKELKKKNVNVTYFEKDKESFPIPNEESRQHLYVALEQFLEVNLKKK